MSATTLRNTFTKQNGNNNMNNINNNNNNNVGNIKTHSATKFNFTRTSKAHSNGIKDGASHSTTSSSEKIKNANKTSGKTNTHKNRYKGNIKSPTQEPNQCQKNSSSGGSDEQQGGSHGSSVEGSGGKSMFRPFVVLAMPGVNLFRRFSTYRRLPQADPAPKDRLEKELDRLTNKIDSLVDKLDDVQLEPPSCPEEQCIICSTNKATMQTFPCTHIAVCRTCFVKTIQSTVAEKKLPLRCVICREKILRLKQHHKKPFRTIENRSNTDSCNSAMADLINVGNNSDAPRCSSLNSNTGVDNETTVAGDHNSASQLSSQRLPNSASNYSISNSRLSASSSNQSFASGVSSVSSGSSLNSASRSLRSFNVDSLSNFQNVNLNPHRSRITRTTSGGSFSGVSRRASRSPSPASSRERSRSFDQNGPSAYFNTNGPLVNLSLDRNSSDDSLNSGSNRSSFSSGVGNNITIPSPGSSSSPRSPISPSWNNDVSEVISRSSKGEVFSSQSKHMRSNTSNNILGTNNTYTPPSVIKNNRGNNLCAPMNANVVNTQATLLPASDKHTVKISNGSSHYKNAKGNSRQQYNYVQYTQDLQGRHKSPRDMGNQSAYHLQSTNNMNSGSNSKVTTGISSLSNGAPTHPGLGRASRLCTMLSPIKESRRENGSNQELRCSPERWSITSASPTHSASSDINGAFGYSPKLSAKPNINNRTGSLERYHIVYEENGTRYKAIKRVPITNKTSNFTNESLANDTMETSAPTSKSTYLLENGVKKKGSSRIRCTEKILNQLEHHTDKIIAIQNRDGCHNRKYMVSQDESNLTPNHESNNLSNNPLDAEKQSIEMFTDLQKKQSNVLNNNSSSEIEGKVNNYSNEQSRIGVYNYEKQNHSNLPQFKKKKQSHKTVTFRDP